MSPENVVITWDDDPAQHEPFLRCEECGTHLCSAEEGDALSVLVSVAEDHVCEVVA